MSKTVEELTALFQAARGRGNVNRTEGDRKGVAAVVRALRDQTYSSDDWKQLNDILGGDAGEKVAEDPLPHLSEREKALFVAALEGDAGPTTPPATAPAPAAPSIARFIDAMQKWAQEDPAGFDDTLSPDVCEWADVGDKYRSACGRSHFAWTSRDGVVVCPHCKAPIKFTEAK